MAELLTFSALAAFTTLVLLEVILGIDNLVVLAILSGKLPPEQQSKARKLGLGIAAGGRVVLLFAITWVITLDQTTVFTLPFDLDHAPGSEAVEVLHEAEAALAEAGDTRAAEAVARGAEAVRGVEGGSDHATRISVKDLILLLGGFFLVAKATWEIHHNLEGGGHEESSKKKKVAATFGAVLVQIIAMDMIFSIDSVLTAVGMVNPDDYTAGWVPLTIMISAVLIAVGVMVVFADPVSNFVNRHPTVKVLALSFMILIGVVLVAEGLHQHIPRGYIYSAMAFSLIVEMLNLRGRKGSSGGGGGHPPEDEPAPPRGELLQTPDEAAATAPA